MAGDDTPDESGLFELPVDRSRSHVRCDHCRHVDKVERDILALKAQMPEKFRDTWVVLTSEVKTVKRLAWIIVGAAVVAAVAAIAPRYGRIPDAPPAYRDGDRLGSDRIEHPTR